MLRMVLRMEYRMSIEDGCDVGGDTHGEAAIDKQTLVNIELHL